MDGLVFVGIVLFLWFLVAPLLGVIGWHKTADLADEIRKLRRDMERGLESAKDTSGPAAAEARPAAPEISTSIETEPDVEPEAEPDVDPDPKLVEVAPNIVSSPTPSVEEKPQPEAENVEPPKPIQTPQWQSKTPEPPAPEKKGRDWEELIAANWMIWIGGLAVAVGGLLLVRYVWEAGLLGPAARVGLAGLFGFALVGVGARADGTRLVTEGRGAIRFLPSILVAAGITVLNGAVFAAGSLYGLIPPLMAFASFVGVAIFAIVLSLRFGSLVAGLGLVGAYSGPLFTGASGGSVTLLLAYSAGVTATALVLALLRQWPQLIIIALGGAAFWGVAGLAADTPDFAVPLYALALFGLSAPLGSATGYEQIKAALPKSGGGIARAILGQGISIGSMVAFILLSGGLLWFEFTGTGSSASLWGMFAFAALAMVLAWWDKVYALMAPLAGVFVIASLLFWPNGAEALIPAVLTAVAGFGGVGTLMALFPRGAFDQANELSATAAITPVAALFIPVSGISAGVSGFFWGYTALVLATVYVAVLEYLKGKSPDFSTNQTKAAAFGLGAFLSAALAPFVFLEGLWLGSALSVLALGICLIHKRFPIDIFEKCGPVAVGAAVVFLMRPWLLGETQISATPIFNELLFGFGIAIAALGVGAWVSKGSERLHQSALGGALILGFALIGLEIRHFAQGGDLYTNGVNLSEVSGYAVTYLGMAVSFAWRLSSRGALYKAGEYFGAGLGGLALIIGLFLLTDEPAIGVPIFNLLFVSVAMPALLLAVYAAVLRRMDRIPEAVAWGWIAIVAGFLWITLETRRMLVGADLNITTSGEGVWAYSIGWLIYAVFLLVWGTLRQRSNARYASLAVLLLAVGKVFFLDLALLEGVVRAASFIGLGASLIGIALFYQRYVFGRGDLAVVAEEA